jgi:hypothetical protein
MFTRIVYTCVFVLFLVSASAFSMSEYAVRAGAPAPPALTAAKQVMEPVVFSSAGDTLWIQAHVDETSCPGDPSSGHGGEATGGPGPTETWCFEGGPGDSCGTNPPWDVLCFSHEDVRAKPSSMGINYWHIDSYRADQRAYCGDYALWCGSDSLWDGYPVECGTWASPPGYGNQWNCIAMLTLPDTFNVANGCTLLFDPRYDTECKYDYFYVDFWNGTAWVTIATFNATSNNPGAECGQPSGGNPDFWGNTDIDHMINVDWQERSNPSWPAFVAGIDASQYSYETGPLFRWRFVSDGAWSDADGRGNTDGGTWIDNVWVWGDGNRYEEDFESGVLDPAYWSLPDPDGLIDQWHITHDPDPPYEGGDGGDRTTCVADSSYVYRARPEGGYPAGVPWRNGWYYRLMGPPVPMLNSGCVVQYDEFTCANEVTCDYPATRVRFYSGSYGTWCPWYTEPIYIPTGCYFWSHPTTDWSWYAPADAESVQYCWDIQDVGRPADFCWGKHKGTDYQVDNVSMGFYDADATLFSARGIDMLQDMFFTDLCAFNSGFSAYNEDTLDYYAGGAHALPAWKQLYVEIRDNDLIQSVYLRGSLDEGASWVSVAMTQYQPIHPSQPDLGGEYYATLCPADFGLAEWDTGTVVWYCVKCTDQLSNEEYFPRTADPSSPDHSGTESDYFELSILPLYPPDFEGARILLVDGNNRSYYDYAPCLSRTDRQRPLEDIYGETLTDAGYCYDKYDISGGGSNVHVHYLCTWNTAYDAVVWFTGPYFSNYLFDGQAQRAMRDYLGQGGKVVVCGDRVAYSLAPPELGGAGEDSMDGDFLSGVLGAEYIQEMASPFTKPYIYCAGVETLTVLGAPVILGFDTLLVYRECPYLKDMSWIRTETAPPMGYFAQPLLTVLNPDVAGADMVTYSEYQNIGQSAFVNFDLCGTVNHTSSYCSGGAAPVPAYDPGVYEGRVELMRLILEDVFGLLPTGGGMAGNPDRPGAVYAWKLAQNAPNPCISTTEIRFEAPHTADVSIAVYNAAGQRVRVLVNESVEPGAHSVMWDGRNAGGQRVSSGVYFLRMQARGFSATRKMLVLN